MYTRRKIVLNLINLLGEATSMQIQKNIFLFTMAIKNKDQIPYHFFPNIKGCYSISLSNDYHILCETGILNYNSFTQKYSLNKNVDLNLFTVDYNTKTMLKKICAQYGTLNEKELEFISLFKECNKVSDVSDKLNVSAQAVSNKLTRLCDKVEKKLKE